MNKFLIAVMVVGASAIGIGGYWWYQHSHRLTWAQVNGMIQDKFPQVPQLSVPALYTLLSDSHQPKPLLLDVRTRIEYQVSHLHHARWIHANESVVKAMAGVPHDQLIVAYCSVGYRSSDYCVQLMKDGFTNVHDLKGSIFQWANAGLPVYRGGKMAHNASRS